MQLQRDSIVRMAGTILLMICALPSLGAADRPLSERDVLCFDLGPVGSTLADRALELNVESLYSPEVGFGWTQRPREEFQRGELRGSRTALSIDGVAGNQISFQADVAPGKWYVTLWLETGGTEQRWPRVTVQGQRQRLRWQGFRPSAEPRDTLPKEFRVFHCTATVDSAGLRLELAAAQDDVRLLGISLIRQLRPEKPEQHAFLRQVEAAGRYQNSKPLIELLRQAEASLDANSNDAFYAIWQQRLELLAAAERYYSMRGWQWADEETGLGMFDRHPQAVMLLDGFLMSDPVEIEPLRERALYSRGRLLYWLAKERGGVLELASGTEDLETLAKRHPDDDLLAMYTGKRVDLPDACDCLEPTAEAPAWSNAQREALCRLRLLVHWWVEQRQADNGELGGKFGDDVEMLRWWAPLCLAGDETALRGWNRLADGVWHSKHVFEGYARKVADVEHAAEFVSDTAPLMLIYRDDPRYEQRLAHSVKFFESLWTGVSAGGNRHFRGAWFSSSAIETDEPKGRDVEYNTRAVQALRYLAWRRSDPKLIQLLHEWSTAWANAAMRTDKGKPKGIIPASIRFPDDAVNGDGPNWYEANMFWDFFEWDHYAGSLMLDQLLFTYTQTGDEHLLQPMFVSLDLIRSEAPTLTDEKLVTLEEGTPTWAADNLMRSTLFWNVVEQWRTMSGDSRWDDLIKQYGTAYGRYRISGDARHLVDGLNVLMVDLRCNTPLKTTEAIFTDRVRVPGAELVKAMLTSDGIQSNLSPYYAVSWQQTDADFTALVSRSGQDQLEVQLFSHGPDDREVVMRVWQLVPSDYEMQCEAEGLVPHNETITVRGLGQRIPITLPSRRLLQVTLRRTP